MLQLFTIISFYFKINRWKQHRIHFVQYPKCLRVFHQTRCVCSLNYPYHNNYVGLRCVIFTRLHYVFVYYNLTSCFKFQSSQIKNTVKERDKLSLNQLEHRPLDHGDEQNRENCYRICIKKIDKNGVLLTFGNTLRQRHCCIIYSRVRVFIREVRKKRSKKKMSEGAFALLTAANEMISRCFPE